MGCYNSVVINAPAEEVWDVLKDFHELSWSKNVVEKVEIVGNKSSNEIGAKRVINDAFQETLLAIDNDAKKFQYSIDDGPGPVSKDNVQGYVGEVTVFSVSENNSSFVLWTTEWKSSGEGGVAEMCNPIYHALLQDLKSHFS